MIEQGQQKKRAIYLDNFPSGFLIIGAIAAVFLLSLMSGVKVVGVDQEKVAIKKDRLILDKDRADFYRKKKEWDGIEARLMAGRTELESLQRQTIDEAGRKDALQKDNKGLDATRQTLKNDVAVLEKQKEVISKSVTESERALDEFQRKLDLVKTEHGGLVQSNQDLMERNKGLEVQLTALKQEIADNDGRMKNAIKDLVTYVEKIGIVSNDFARKKDEFDRISGSIQENTSKLSVVSQDMGAALKDFTVKTNELKASKTSANVSIDELSIRTKELSGAADRMSSLRQELINAVEKIDKAAGSVKKPDSQSDDIRTILDKLDGLSNKINAMQGNSIEIKGNK